MVSISCVSSEDWECSVKSTLSINSDWRWEWRYRLGWKGRMIRRGSIGVSIRGTEG